MTSSKCCRLNQIPSQNVDGFGTRLVNAVLIQKFSFYVRFFRLPESTLSLTTRILASRPGLVQCSFFSGGLR